VNTVTISTGKAPVSLGRSWLPQHPGAAAPGGQTMPAPNRTAAAPASPGRGGLHPSTPPRRPVFSRNDLRAWARLEPDKSVCFGFPWHGHTLLKEPAPAGAAFQYHPEWEALCTAFPFRKKKNKNPRCRNARCY